MTRAVQGKTRPSQEKKAHENHLESLLIPWSQRLDMIIRFILGPLFIVIILGLFLLDWCFFSVYRPLVSMLIAGVGALGWLEYTAMTGLGDREKGGSRFFAGLGLAGILCFYLLSWWGGCSGGKITLGTIAAPVEEAANITLFVSCMAAFTYTVFQKDYLRLYWKLFETLLGILALGFFYSYLLRIYLLPESRGFQLGLVFFAGIKGTDIVAYLVGRFFGRIHCVPVSPKKTLAGCLGALAWGGLWFGGAAWAFTPNLFIWPQGMVFGIILSGVAQIGDFTESLIKREYQMKDSQPLLPEFGGVLDMSDSLIFSGYLFWCLI